MQKLTNQSLEGRREYVVEPFFSIWAPERACLFCKKCSDFIWDYTNGPYMFFCDEDEDGEKDLTEKGAIGKCDVFEECYKEVEKRNQDLKQQEKEIKEFREKVITDSEYKKLCDEFVKIVTDKVLYGNFYEIPPEMLTVCPKPLILKKEGSHEDDHTT